MRKLLTMAAVCAGFIPAEVNAAPPKWAYIAHSTMDYYYVDINNIQKISSNKSRIWANAVELDENLNQRITLNEIDCSERSLSIINMSVFDKNGKVIVPGYKPDTNTSYPQPGRVNHTFIEFLCDGESLGGVTDNPVANTLLRELMNSPN